MPSVLNHPDINFFTWVELLIPWGIPVINDYIGGSGWDLISGGKRVGELHGLLWKFVVWT